MIEGRYNQIHYYGEVSFYLSDYRLNIEECRFLILKVIEQTTRDYLSLFGSEFTNDQQIWLTAVDFIFDTSYRIRWGDMELSLEDLLGIVDIDVAYFRERMNKRFIDRHGVNHNGET